MVTVWVMRPSLLLGLAGALVLLSVGLSAGVTGQTGNVDTDARSVCRAIGSRATRPTFEPTNE
jgi:hypothetical protein